MNTRELIVHRPLGVCHSLGLSSWFVWDPRNRRKFLGDFGNLGDQSPIEGIRRQSNKISFHEWLKLYGYTTGSWSTASKMDNDQRSLINSNNGSTA